MRALIAQNYGRKLFLQIWKDANVSRFCISWASDALPFQCCLLAFADHRQKNAGVHPLDMEVWQLGIFRPVSDFSPVKSHDWYHEHMTDLKLTRRMITKLWFRNRSVTQCSHVLHSNKSDYIDWCLMSRRGDISWRFYVEQVCGNAFERQRQSIK